MKYFLVSILVLFAITACDNSKKYKTELDAIQNCQTTIDSVKSKINGIDIDSLIYMQKVTEDNEGVIRKYYAPDTIDMVFAEKLNLNKGIRKSLKSAKLDRTKLLTEIDSLTLQFSNLETDIVEGVLSKEQIDQYLAVEKGALANLELSFKSFNINQVNQKRNFYFVTPQITAYVDSLLKNFEK